MQPRVIGLDLSLTSTGLADTGWQPGEPIALRTIRTRKTGGTLTDTRKRLAGIVFEVADTISTGGPHPALIVMEGPSYGSAGAGTWDRAGLWWLVLDRLMKFYGDRVTIVPPALVKKYATGSGKGEKAAVCSAAGSRYGQTFATDDEADAFVLAAMGLDHLGCPVVEVPKAHRDALAKVAWPEVPRGDGTEPCPMAGPHPRHTWRGKVCAGISLEVARGDV